MFVYLLWFSLADSELKQPEASCNIPTVSDVPNRSYLPGHQRHPKKINKVNCSFPVS